MKKYLLPGVATLGVLAGLAGANIAANAESTTNSTTNSTSSTTTGGTTDRQAPPSGPRTVNGKTETELTGDDLTKATNAAKTKYPNATVDRVETDIDGDGTYEVHMDNNGQRVTVFLDSNFAVTSTANGMSNKLPAGGPQGNSSTSNSTSTSS